MHEHVHPSVTHLNVGHSIAFYIGIYKRAFNINHEKIDMVSPTYMVEQCLEKWLEFYVEYVTLSSV